MKKDETSEDSEVDIGEEEYPSKLSVVFHTFKNVVVNVVPSVIAIKNVF